MAAERAIRQQAAEIEKLQREKKDLKAHITALHNMEVEFHGLKLRNSQLKKKVHEYEEKNKKNAKDARRVRKKLYKEKAKSKRLEWQANNERKRYVWWKSRSIKWEGHARKRGFVGDVDEGGPGTPEPVQEPLSPVSSISPPRSLFNGGNRSDTSESSSSSCRFCTPS